MLRHRLVLIFLALGIGLWGEGPWGKAGHASPLVLPIDLLEQVPTTYVPGEPIEFQLRLPAISNLGAYQIDLLVESATTNHSSNNTATAGVDYAFDLAATSAADVSYVFSSSAYFAAATNVESPNRQRITVTDFIINGTDVVPGSNDLIGTIVLQLAESLRASLEIKIDAYSLILDTPQVVPTSVAEFQFIQSGILASGAVTLRRVPEPATMLLLLFSGLIAILGTRSTRKNNQKRNRTQL